MKVRTLIQVGLHVLSLAVRRCLISSLLSLARLLRFSYCFFQIWNDCFLLLVGVRPSRNKMCQPNLESLSFLNHQSATHHTKIDSSRTVHKQKFQSTFASLLRFWAFGVCKEDPLTAVVDPSIPIAFGIELRTIKLLFPDWLFLPTGSQSPSRLAVFPPLVLLASTKLF